MESSHHNFTLLAPACLLAALTLAPLNSAVALASAAWVASSHMAPSRLLGEAGDRVAAVREQLEGVHVGDLERELEGLLNVLLRHGVLRDSEQLAATRTRLCGDQTRAPDRAACMVDSVVWAQLALVDGARLGADRQPLPPHRKRLTHKEKTRLAEQAQARRRRGIEQAVAALRPSDRTVGQRAARWLDEAGPGTWTMYRSLVTGLARYRAIASGAPILPEDLPVATKTAWRRSKERRHFLRKLSPAHRLAVHQRLCFEGYCAPPPQTGPPAPTKSAKRRRKPKAVPLEAQLAARLRAWQHDRGLRPSALIDAKTRDALSVPMVRRVEQIRLAMQRIRDTGVGSEQDFLVANIPAFRLDVWRAGKVTRTHRTQVGKGSRRVRRKGRLIRIPGMRTPLMSMKLRYLVLNPEWVVPSSIRREYRWKVKKNPNWFAENGFEVRIASNGGEYLVMKSGEKNLLGVVKSLFPNQHLVYLHDTSSQTAFRYPVRLKSHGCVRVQDAQELARDLLGHDQGRRVTDRAWARRIEGTINKWVSLKRPLPIHLVYWTADAAQDGRIRFYPDAYNYDGPDRQIAMQVAEERLAGLPALAKRLPAGPGSDDCPGAAGKSPSDCP